MKKSQFLYIAVSVSAAFIVLSGSPIYAATFAVGDRVKTTADLNIRSAPGHLIVGTIPAGTAGAVIGGPTTYGGYTWWQVSYSSPALTGWSAENWLAANGVSTAPTGTALVSIFSLFPSEGPPGTQVTITGTGFSPTGNKLIVYKPDLTKWKEFPGIPSDLNGTRLTVTVPLDIPYDPQTTNRFYIQVFNASGGFSSGTAKYFKVTASGTPPPPTPTPSTPPTTSTSTPTPPPVVPPTSVPGVPQNLTYSGGVCLSGRHDAVTLQWQNPSTVSTTNTSLVMIERAVGSGNFVNFVNQGALSGGGFPVVYEDAGAVAYGDALTYRVRYLHVDGTRSSYSNIVTLQSCQAAVPTPTPTPAPTPASPAPSVDLKVNNSDGPVTITYNTAATLSWTSSNAASCTSNFGSASTSGNKQSGVITVSQTFTITCTGAGGSKSDSVVVNTSSTADLQVVSISPSGPFTTGQNVLFQVVIKNAGGGKMPGSGYDADLMIDYGNDNPGCAGPGDKVSTGCNDYIGKILSVPFIDPGKTYTFSIPWTATCQIFNAPCTHRIRFRVDLPHNLMPESSESNNFLTRLITVNPGTTTTTTTGTQTGVTAAAPTFPESSCSPQKAQTYLSTALAKAKTLGVTLAGQSFLGCDQRNLNNGQLPDALPSDVSSYDGVIFYNIAGINSDPSVALPPQKSAFMIYAGPGPIGNGGSTFTLKLSGRVPALGIYTALSNSRVTIEGAPSGTKYSFDYSALGSCAGTQFQINGAAPPDNCTGVVASAGRGSLMATLADRFGEALRWLGIFGR